MDYIEKAEAALLSAEKAVTDGEDPKKFLDLADRWKGLAEVQQKQTVQIPPLAPVKLANPRTSFFGGQYL